MSQGSLPVTWMVVLCVVVMTTAGFLFDSAPVWFLYPAALAYGYFSFDIAVAFYEWWWLRRHPERCGGGGLFVPEPTT